MKTMLWNKYRLSVAIGLGVLLGLTLYALTPTEQSRTLVALSSIFSGLFSLVWFIHISVNYRHLFVLEQKPSAEAKHDQ